MPREDITIRPAKFEDLDRLVRVYCDANGESLQYRMPRVNEFYDDYYEYCKNRFVTWLEQPDKYKVFVAEIPEDASRPDGPKIIPGFTAWDVDHFRKAKPYDQRLDTRRDVDLKHNSEFLKMTARAFDRYFKPYGPGQTFLQCLMVDVKYHRMGIATALWNDGLKLLRTNGQAVSLMGTIMGQNFYERVGCVAIGHDTAQVEGEEEAHMLMMMLSPPLQ